MKSMLEPLRKLNTNTKLYTMTENVINNNKTRRKHAKL